MMGLTDDRDISETVSETWSTDVLGSDFDPNMDEDRLQEIAGATLFFWLYLFNRSKLMNILSPFIFSTETVCC